MNAGNTPKLAIAMNYIDDNFISDAIDYTPIPHKRIIYFWKPFVAIAVCLCVVISSVWFSQYPYSDEGRNDPSIHTGTKYKVNTFEVSEITEPIQLFTYSVAPPEEICYVVSQVHPDVDCAHAMYAFGFSEDVQENYWFPVLEDGRIVDIVFATIGSKGQVIAGHSQSHVDELNSIAKFTSLETPVYIIAGEYFNYYVIGDTAYVSSNVSRIETEYIGEFFTPDKDIVVIEIP